MSALATLAQPIERATPFEVVVEPRRPTFELIHSTDSVEHGSEPETGDVLQARALVARFPDSPTALGRLAQALMFDERREEAMGVAQSVGEHVETHPEISALLIAGYVLLRLGEPEKAEVLVGKNSAGAASVLLARCALARGEVELALKRLTGVRTYDAAVLSGSILLELGRFADAVHAYRMAVALGPTTSDIMLGLAHAHNALGARGQALRAATVATGLSPLRIDAASMLAFLRFEHGDAEGASSELQRVAHLRPTSVRPPMYLASLQFALGFRAEALKDMKRLASSKDHRFWRASPDERNQLETMTLLSRARLGELAPENVYKRLLKLWISSDFKNELAGQMAVLSLSRREQAAELRPLVDAMQASVSARGVHWGLYQLAYLEERFTDAISEARSWLASEPLNYSAAAALMTLVGDVHHDLDGAVQVGREFRRRSPSDGHMVNTLAYYLILAGDTVGARRLLDLPVPETPYIVATRGLLALHDGRLDEGRQLYRNAVALAGGSLGELIQIRLGFALKALGQPVPEMPDLTPWREDLRFVLMERFHGFTL